MTIEQKANDRKFQLNSQIIEANRKILELEKAIVGYRAEILGIEYVADRLNDEVKKTEIVP